MMAHVDGRARLLTERISRLPIEERITLAVMWGSLLVLALPGLVLTFLKDPENLPIALTVTIGGTIATAAFSVLKLRAPHVPQRGGNRGHRAAPRRRGNRL
jgi:hypothetical protein